MALTEAEALSLVARIVAFNDAWHALRDLWPDRNADEPALASLRDLKGALQARLIRDGAGLAYLRRDDDPRLAEPCYPLG